MFNKEDKTEDVPKKKKKDFESIIPKRDFHIFCNKDDIKLVKGERIEIPSIYIQNLKTEKVI